MSPQTAHTFRQGVVAGRNVAAWLGHGESAAFDYHDHGLAVTLGKRQGVAEVKGCTFTGFIAWWMGRSYHLLMIPGLARESRVVTDWTMGLLFRAHRAGLGTLGKPTRSPNGWFPSHVGTSEASAENDRSGVERGVRQSNPTSRRSRCSPSACAPSRARPSTQTRGRSRRRRPVARPPAARRSPLTLSRQLRGEKAIGVTSSRTAEHRAGVRHATSVPARPPRCNVDAPRPRTPTACRRDPQPRGSPATPVRRTRGRGRDREPRIDEHLLGELLAPFTGSASALASAGCLRARPIAGRCRRTSGRGRNQRTGGPCALRDERCPLP